MFMTYFVLAYNDNYYCYLANDRPEEKTFRQYKQWQKIKIGKVNKK